MVDLSKIRPAAPVQGPLIQSPPAQPRFTASIVVILVLAVALVLSVFANHRSNENGTSDDEEQGSSVSASGSVLVLVSDRQAPPIWQVEFERGIDSFLSAHKLKEFRWLDDDKDPKGAEMIAIAAKKKIDPPVAAIVKDGKVIRVAQWVESKTAMDKWAK